MLVIRITHLNQRLSFEISNTCMDVSVCTYHWGKTVLSTELGEAQTAEINALDAVELWLFVL